MFAVYWSCQSEINLWQCPGKCATIRQSFFESYCTTFLFNFTAQHRTRQNPYPPNLVE